MRRLFALASAISLLLCLATVVLWVRSYRPRDAVERDVFLEHENAESDMDDIVYSSEGLILWVHQRYPDIYGPAKSQAVHWRWFNPLPPEKDPEPGRNELKGLQGLSRRSSLGISTNLKLDRKTLASQWRVEGFYFLVPHRILALAFSILPAAFVVIRFRKRKRSSEVLCRSCGYDLTGNTSGVCPECGQPIPQKTEATS
jgi:hypothetical protein